MDLDRPFLPISDLQQPYTHPKAFEFIKYLKRHFKVPDENMMCVGDEVDQFWGSMHPKSPNANLTATQELKRTIEVMKEWYSEFPKMKLAVSNHGLRWIKKASMAEIPSELMRTYQEVIEAPLGWEWKTEWFVPTKHPWRMLHGMGYSGANGTRNMMKDYGMSVLHGHLHSYAQVVFERYGNTDQDRVFRWGCNSGCLIDVDQFAFDYEKWNRSKPCVGTAMVFNKGSTPVWFPIEE